MPPATRAHRITLGARGLVAALLLGTVGLAALPAPARASGADAAGQERARAATGGADARTARSVRAILDAMRDRSFTDVNDRVMDLSNPLLRAYLGVEAMLADTARPIDADAASALLAIAPDLPQRRALEKRVAAEGGVLAAPPAPAIRARRADPTPRRNPPKSSTEPAALALAPRVNALIKTDDSVGAEALVRAALPGLSTVAAAEWLHKAAWSHYIENRDDDAARVAREAATRGGAWGTMATHVIGLAAWRGGRFGEAEAAFARVARGGHDADLRAAGAYWAARSAQAAKRPANVTAYLRVAAAERHSFYGLIAREALGLAPTRPDTVGDARSRGLDPRFRAALSALIAGGADGGAAAWLRRRADSATADDHAALRALAGELNLPATRMQLAQAVPPDAPATTADRFPVPHWRPASGWTVDPSLVLAHAMQESGFRPDVTSPAGAAGLMQVRAGTAGDLARWGAVDGGLDGALTDPGVSLTLGQAYLRRLAASPATEGKLPKIVAAYNAGPAPIGRWRDTLRDQDDPLLFIESIPYGETRQYVGTVLRNYWAYRANQGGAAPSLTAMVEGRWTGLPAAGPVTADAGTRTRRD